MIAIEHPPITGTGIVTHLSVVAPSSETSGTPFWVTVTAQDQNNNMVSSYSGAVQLSSNDTGAVFQANPQLSGGTGTFSATLINISSQTTITASSGGASGTSAFINVTSRAAHFLLTAVPTSVPAGTQFNFTVTAQDLNNSTLTNYSGIVQFSSSSDPQANFPQNNVGLTSGVGTFPATLNTPGTQTITANDSANSMTGQSGSIIVVGAATHFSIAAPTSATSGTPFSFAVTPLDSLGNVTTFTSTVKFIGTDSFETLPAPTTLGTGSFQATLVTPGTQTITVEDTATQTIKGTASISVSALPLTITSPSNLGAVVVGSQYLQNPPMLQLMATGGTPPYSWTWSGTTPHGLTLWPNGVISGVPTQQETDPFSATVTDSSSPSHLAATQSFTIQVVSVPQNPTATPYGNTVYVGQTTSYTWSASDVYQAGYSWTSANDYLALNITPSTDNWFSQYGACWIEFHPFTQTVVLYPDSTSGSLQSAAINSGETLSNSRCAVTLDGIFTIVPVLNGKTASVTLPVTFSSTFVGNNQRVFVQAYVSCPYCQAFSINPGSVNIADPTVTVTPASPPAITSNLTQQFTAAVSGGSNTTVSWSISPSTSGAISSSGLYTPPPLIPTRQNVTVTATSLADPTAQGSAVVPLAPPPQNLTISTAINASTLCQALNTLTLNGNATVGVGGNAGAVTCTAGSRIILDPNFHAVGSSGTTFIAVVNQGL